MNYTLTIHLTLCIYLITISSINQWSKLPIGDTFIWYIVYVFTLLGFFVAKNKLFNLNDKSRAKVIRLYLLWSIICIVRGLFVADNYWEWKNLTTTGLTLLLPLTIYVSNNSILLQRLINLWLKYSLPSFFILLPFLYGEAIGRYLVPLSFLLLFFFILPIKWKFITLASLLYVIISDYTARSNIIKFVLPFLLSFAFYFKENLSIRIINFVRFCLIITPILLFILAISGLFNVFEMNKYLKGEYTASVIIDGEEQKESLIADTRTLLYKEVLSSAIKHNYLMLGRTPARGNESELFGEVSLYELKTGKMERFNNEVSILNVLTWTGVFGVFLYLLVFWKASSLAIKESNSFTMRLIGLSVAFRWCYAWVEDFSVFDLSNIYLWIMIGMCFSSEFRKMSDKDLAYWVHGVFKDTFRLDGRTNKANNVSKPNYLSI